MTLLSLLTGCATITPDQCRQVGVDVPNGAPITGRIVEQNIADAGKVRAACQSPFAERYGCSLAVDAGEYAVWSVDNPRVLVHEQCHALYQAGHRNDR